MKEVDELYGKMLAVFEEKTGFTMDDTADLAVRLYAAAAQIQTLYAYSDWAINQSFPQTATGEYLDYHAALRGIVRKAGTKARGSLRFRLDAAREDDLTVKRGTVCATAGLVRFVTTEDGVIAAGALYADIPAEAESVGTSGNAGAETITVMTRAPEGVSGVLNPKAFTGGSGAETDEELRARVLDSFIRLPNGANAAFYELRALSHAGVEAAVVIPRMNGIGTVGVVIAAPEGVPSEALLQQVQDAGVKIAHVTLHVGLGTFRPVKVEDVTQHHMHSEFYVVEEDQAKLINDTKAAGGRVIAVGTTSCRTLESATGEDGILKAGSGWTEIFIYPGYRFKMIDGLITNFHLPESTLVMLVSALAGKEHIMAAYEEAVREKYRFFSFGDAMMIE